MNKTKNISKLKRRNAKLFPIYKMFSWDLLCFYSIQFLFYTITKRITPSQIIIINGLYQIFSIFMYIPAVAFTDYLGKKRSMILGNILEIIFVIILIFVPGVFSLIVGNLFFALGYRMKTISETNLLYDSVSTRGGEGLYSKIDSKGASLYYIFDGICCLVAGYLFVINNYLPIIICLVFAIISTILSFGFKEIYKIETNKRNKKITKYTKEYALDLKKSMTFILKSSRMKAIIIFGAVFTGLIGIIETCRGDLLTDLLITPEQFSIIFAIISFIGGLALSSIDKIENKFKNRSLTFIVLIYLTTCIVIGLMTVYISGSIVMPIILLMYAIQEMCTSIWYILESKYIKNFTTPEKRNKIAFTYGFIGAIIASILSVIAGTILDNSNSSITFLISGLGFLAIMIIILDYMKSRVGLKPEEYKKKDIDF